MSANDFGLELGQITFYTAIPDGIASMVKCFFVGLREYVTRSMTRDNIHRKISMLALGLFNLCFADVGMISYHFDLCKAMGLHNSLVLFILHQHSHRLGDNLVCLFVNVVFMKVGKKHDIDVFQNIFQDDGEVVERIAMVLSNTHGEWRHTSFLAKH